MMGFSPLSSPLGRGVVAREVLMMVGCGNADIWVIDRNGGNSCMRDELGRR